MSCGFARVIVVGKCHAISLDLTMLRKNRWQLNAETLCLSNGYTTRLFLVSAPQVLLGTALLNVLKS